MNEKNNKTQFRPNIDNDNAYNYFIIIIIYLSCGI